MRIQPHVWAAREPRTARSYLKDVLRNAVSTHGNLRGIVGAAFHSAILAKTLSAGEIQGPEVWHEACADSRLIAELVAIDRELSSFWLPVWEQQTNTSFSAELDRVLEEVVQDIRTLEKRLIKDEESYKLSVESLGALDPAFRGSGTKTALLAAALAWGYRERPIKDALLVAVNQLGSDTDTIATMAGAILGAVAQIAPEESLLDREYIEKEASRLYDVSIGAEVMSFGYPDLMSWSPPKNQTSAVGIADARIVVAGLGAATPFGDAHTGQGQERAIWRWLRLDFGQTIIAKQRPELRPLRHSEVLPSERRLETKNTRPEQNSLFPQEGTRMAQAKISQTNRTINDLTNEAIKTGFDPSTIGRHIIELSSQDDGIERCLAYVAIISKARKARLEQRR
jgi:ADP-ribosylglycohydrolase